MDELRLCGKSQQTLIYALNRLPETLEAIYDQILTRIAKVNALNAMKLLVWLAFAETPLHIDDLAKIVEFDVQRHVFDPAAKLHNPADVMKICSSLVTRMVNDTVQFAHASIRQYFHGKQLGLLGLSVKLDPSFCHSFIGQCGLAYILHTEEICPDGICHKDIPEKFKHPLLTYSAYFRPKHILACNEELAVMEHIMRLFGPGILTKWVKAYNYVKWAPKYD